MPGRRQYSGGGSHAKHGHKMGHGALDSGGPVAGAAAYGGYNGLSDRRRDQRNGNGNHGYRKQWGIESYLADDENFPSFQAQLVRLDLQLRDIPADGNCLFRALGDQLEGHCRNHFRHRQAVVQYMRANRFDFEPFTEDDIPFDDHITNLQKLGTHAGNDAIVAFAKLNSSNVVIHQLNGKPLLIQGPQTATELTRQLHIAYHNGDHYSSVRRKGDNTESPANIRLEDAFTGEAEPRKTLKQGYNGIVSAKRDLEDIENQVQIATNCMDMSQVRESLIECDYDVDLAIADLLQQMEMTNGNDGDAGSQPSAASHANGLTAANGEASAGVAPVASGQTQVLGSSLKSNGQGQANGKGHKVHFREDSFGGSSGYGSMSSKEGGAKPKVNSKKEKKLEKKRRAEEARRQKYLQAKQENSNLPVHPDVRDVMVVSVKDKRFTHI